MSRQHNRRAEMIARAAEQFMARGYARTGVRQIAREVGCTEAALYYHFPGGKRALLAAVIEALAPDFSRGLESCQAASSLAELLSCLAAAIRAHPQNQQRLRWLLMEFSQLRGAEQALVRRKIVDFQAHIAELLRPFLPPKARDDTAWLLICATQGYFTLFNHLGLAAENAYSLETQQELLSRLLAASLSADEEM